MESSNTPSNTPFDEVQIGESKDDLPATIKQELESNLKFPSNSNHYTSENTDMLSSVKTESEYEYDDKSHLYDAREDIKRWTVTSSAVIPLVKQEHKLDPDHRVFECTQPEGAMQAPILGTDILSSSANGNKSHPQSASKLSLLNSDANKEDPLLSKLADTQEYRNGDKSIIVTNPEKGLPQGKTSTSSQVTSKDHQSEHQCVHTGEMPYKCSLCGKCFTRKNHLTKHERLHTGEKSFKCAVCEKEFTLSGSLTRHERIHTGEKPYKCSICNKEFARSGVLKKQKFTHTGEKPYKCSFCGKKFAQSSNLSTHRRSHTGEKPYKCSICDKEFARSGVLKVHKRTHTGEKPYQCSVCGKKFEQS